MLPDEAIALRKEMKLTQGGLAGKLGMSTRAWQDIENGRADLRPIHVLALERVAIEAVALGGDYNLLRSGPLHDVVRAAAAVPQHIREHLTDN